MPSHASTLQLPARGSRMDMLMQLDGPALDAIARPRQTLTPPLVAQVISFTSADNTDDHAFLNDLRARAGVVVCGVTACTR
jgi:hypothetical protein